MSKTDPLLTAKVKHFFETHLDLDPEQLEDFLNIADVIISTLASIKTPETAYKALLDEFEVEADEFPLTPSQTLTLWKLITDHQRGSIGSLLRNTSLSSLESKAIPNKNNDNNTASPPNVTETPTPSSTISTKVDSSTPLSEYQSTPKIELTKEQKDALHLEKLQRRREQKSSTQQAVKGYQDGTHNDDLKQERLKKDIYGSKIGLERALGGQNGALGVSAPTSAYTAPRTAFELVYADKTGDQLLREETAQINSKSRKIIENSRQLVQTQDNNSIFPPQNDQDNTQNRHRGRDTRPASPPQRINYGNMKNEGTKGDTRDRARDYTNSSTIDSKYLDLPDAFNSRADETLPLQYKVYRAKVVEPKDVSSAGGSGSGGMQQSKTVYSVRLSIFPDIPAILDASQVNITSNSNDVMRSRDGLKLQSGQDIFVKVLSDYVSLYKSELQLLQEQQDLMRNRLGNDVMKLKNNKLLKQTEPDVIITVSMLDVDQQTGTDLNPILSIAASKQINRTGGDGKAISNTNKKKQNFSGLADDALDKVKEAGKHIRESSQERWREMIAERGQTSAQQQKKRALLDKKKLQTTRVDHDGVDNFIELSDDEHHAEVDIADIEPSFIRGFETDIHTLTNDALNSMALTQLDGDLTRTARAQTQQAIERRQIKQQLMKDAVEQAISETGGGEAQKLEDSSKAWNDPLQYATLHGENKYGTDTNALKLKQQVMSDVQSTVLQKRNAADSLDGSRPALPPQKVVTYGFFSEKTIDEQRKSLPIYDRRDDFLEMVKHHQISVVVAETGSGKTTQMGQYLFEAGWGNRGIIGCTQPRRVAATSVSQRVADEVGCELGSIVGYSVRFDEKTSAATRIKYMTDGMLLREILLDPTLSRYSCMIIDEAHERGVNTDVLLALIKAACKQRPDLRFIVTSATLDSEKFSNYLNKCPVFEIQGRTHPVVVHYSPTPESDYFEAALKTVMALHLEKPAGDILIFLTGEEEINDAVDLLSEQMEILQRKRPGQMLPLDVYPIYSSLPSEIQTRIFEKTPPNRRKCVIATNIAEASVTIDGIVYVIDAGVCKVAVYDPKQGIESLQVTPISQAQARQRAGRAGRTQPGECYRLYTEQAFENEMTPTTVPELQRCDLSSVILLLKALGINDLLGFDFIDPPATSSMLLALRQLFWLGAVDNDGLLTPVGARLAMLPVSPNLGKMLLVAADLGCLDEITSVVALVSGDELFLRPKESSDSADKTRASFAVRDGDHATLANVFLRWEAEGKSKTWCAKNYVSVRALETAYNVKLQLIRTLTNMKVELSSCGKNWALISRAVTAGLFMNAAKREVQEDKSAKDSVLQQTRTITMYKSLTYGNSAPIHPSSSLTNHMPGYIVYQKMLYTTKEWLHTCTVIHPQWLLQLAPHLYAEKSELSQGSKHNRTQLTELSNPHHAPGAWRLDKRR